MTLSVKELLRSIPSVASLLEREEVHEWLHGLPRATVVAAVQAAAQGVREAILAGRLTEPSDAASILALAEEDLVARSLPPLRRVINATGIVLHTGLGRAPLCDAALEAIMEGASGYCNLEYELATGGRGKRNTHVVDDLIAVTGAQSAVVVNNNAAATFLILRTFGAGRETIVSRGQLIEIGGSYRLPDIMHASGTTLREVGTTNRTRIGDYEKAICERTAMLLRAHPSNYRVVGFTEEASIESLVALARRHSLLAVDDVGSGALLDFSEFGLPPEPCVRDSIAAGADLVCFSGDKLLGGPQCGVIVGRRDLIERIETDPLARTYRVDKLTLLALSATLRLYLDPEEAKASLPTLAMLSASTETLASRASALVHELESALPDEKFYVGSDVSFAGGGSLPGAELPTVVVRWRPSRLSAEAMAAALRAGEPPVVARIRDGAVCFDLRTVRESDFECLVGAASAAAWDPKESEREPGGISLPIL